MDSFLFETLVYLTWGGCVQFLCATLAAPFYFLIAGRVSKQPYSELFRTYLVFNTCLLLWGCLGHYLFLALTFGKFYVSVDRLVDWFPMIPFGQWVLDQGFGGSWHGHLSGSATLWQLRLIWLAIALPVWILAIASTRVILCKFPRVPGCGAYFGPGQIAFRRAARR